MLKRIIKTVTIVVFIVCVIGVAYIYFEDDVELLKKYAISSLYLAIFLMATGGIYGVVRRYISHHRENGDPEFKRSKDYWRKNIRVVRRSSLARGGNPFKRIPTYLYLKTGTSSSIGGGLSVMGGEYQQGFLNLFVGSSVLLVECPVESIERDITLLRRIGRSSYKGIILDESSLLAINEQHESEKSAFELITTALRRTLPVYLVLRDHGDVANLKSNRSLSTKILDSAPLGFINNINESESITSLGVERVLGRIEVLRNADIDSYKNQSLPLIQSWTNIERQFRDVLGSIDEIRLSKKPVVRGGLYTDSILSKSQSSHKGLHDVLFGDKGISSYLTRDPMRNYRMVAYAGICAVASLILTQSFSSAKEIIEQSSQLVSTQFQNDEQELFYRTYDAYLNEANSEGGLSNYIFDVRTEVQHRFQEKYIKDFRRSAVDMYMSFLLDANNSNSLNNMAARHIYGLIGLASLLRGEQDAQALNVFAGNLEGMLTVNPDSMQLSVILRSLIRYVDWEDEANKRLLLQNVRNLIGDLYLNNSGNGDLVASIVSDANELAAVRIRDYLTRIPGDSDLLVTGLYTKEGLIKYDAVFKGIKNNVGQQDVLPILQQNRSFYLHEYVNQWKSGLDVYRSEISQLSSTSLSQVLVGISNGKLLYREFIQDMSDNLNILKGEIETDPSFVEQVHRWARMNNSDYRKKLASKGIFGGISDKSTIAVSRVRSMVKKESEQETQYRLDKTLLPLIIEREELLKKLAIQTNDDPSIAFNVLQASNSEKQGQKTTAKPKELVNQLDWVEKRLMELLGVSAGTSVYRDVALSESNAVVRKLLENTSDYIQTQWESSVLFELANSAGWERSKLVQGNKGLIWKFKNEVLEPFIRNVGGRRYEETKIRGMRVGLNQGILSLLNIGKIDEDLLGKELSFRVFALPTSVNSTAVEIPDRTQLELSCTSGNQTLTNENYPINKVLKWVPEECSDVILRIGFGHRHIEKVYAGYQGFLKFIQDFKGGKREYLRKDFSQNQSLFAALNIEKIKVRFRINSDLPVDHLLSVSASSIPDRITTYNQGKGYATN